MVARLPHERLVGARRVLARARRPLPRRAHGPGRLPRLPAAQGLYLFGYSIMYFYTQLEISDPIPTMIYFGYMLVGSLVFALVTGTVGFYSSWQFVWTIYAAVKVD